MGTQSAPPLSSVLLGVEAVFSTLRLCPPLSLIGDSVAQHRPLASRMGRNEHWLTLTDLQCPVDQGSQRMPGFATATRNRRVKPSPQSLRVCTQVPSTPDEGYFALWSYLRLIYLFSLTPNWSSV